MPANFETLSPRHSNASIEVVVPNAPGFVGTRLLTQWVVPSHGNSLGLSLSNGVECRFGSAHNARYSLVQGNGAAAASGRVRFDRVPVVRLHFVDS